MTETEHQLLQALLALENSIRTTPKGEKNPELPRLFERIDQFTRQLPPGTNLDLLHCLHKKSYEKARLCLQGRAGENESGDCPHSS